MGFQRVLKRARLFAISNPALALDRVNKRLGIHVNSQLSRFLKQLLQLVDTAVIPSRERNSCLEGLLSGLERGPLGLAEPTAPFHEIGHRDRHIAFGYTH